jgi:hypothetical protein
VKIYLKTAVIGIDAFGRLAVWFPGGDVAAAVKDVAVIGSSQANPGGWILNMWLKNRSVVFLLWCLHPKKTVKQAVIAVSSGFDGFFDVLQMVSYRLCILSN